MNCQTCNTPLAEDAKFCAACGAPVLDVSKTQPSAAAAVPPAAPPPGAGPAPQGTHPAATPAPKAKAPVVALIALILGTATLGYEAYLYIMQQTGWVYFQIDVGSVMAHYGFMVLAGACMLAAAITSFVPRAHRASMPLAAISGAASIIGVLYAMYYLIYYGRASLDMTSIISIQGANGLNVFSKTLIPYIACTVGVCIFAWVFFAQTLKARRAQSGEEPSSPSAPNPPGPTNPPPQ